MWRAEPAGSGAAVWDRSADGGEDAGFLSAAGIPAESPAGVAEAGFRSSGSLIGSWGKIRVSRPRWQHTSKRIFEPLRDEHVYAGGIAVVKDYVHERRERQREMSRSIVYDNLERRWRVSWKTADG